MERTTTGDVYGENPWNVLHEHVSTPVKMLKVEKIKQIERVKQAFPEEEGVVTDGFFSSRIAPKGLLGEPKDKIINLASLSEEVFKGGRYKILGVDPNLHWHFAVATLERFVETYGPIISFYLEKDGLRGILNAEMGRHENKFDAKDARIKRTGSDIVYEINPLGLNKVDVLTGQEKEELQVKYSRSHDIGKFNQITKSLTAQQVADYLAKEMAKPADMRTQLLETRVPGKKLTFLSKEGTVTDDFFSSKTVPRGFFEENENQIINLGLLIDELFKGGKYSVVEFEPNGEWIHSAVISDKYEPQFWKSKGTVIGFYLQKDGLRGILNVRMSKPDKESNGIGAKIKKFGSEAIYLVGPGNLEKGDVLTGKREYERHTSYNRDMEVTRPLTTSQALAYLRREIA